jgi:fructokinase
MTKSLAGYIALPEVADADTFVVAPALGGNAGPLGAIVLGAQALDEQLQVSFTTR